MARASGARSAMALAFESTYGTAPGSGFLQTPFVGETLGLVQPLIADETLGLGREPQAPARDAISVDGEVTVDVDTVRFGHWLKLMFGAPTTTGTGPYTHVYASGGTSLPSAAIEVGSPEVPSYAMYTGVKANTLAMDFTRAGNLRARLGLMGQAEALASSTAAGTPTTITPVKLHSFTGAVTRDGSALGNVTAASFTYSNNLDPVGTLRGDGLIDGLDPLNGTLSGSLTARFADLTLVDQAAAGTPCALTFTWTISASLSLSVKMEAVHLPRVKREIAGPAGREVTFDLMGTKGASPARLLTATLVNGVSSYA